MQRKTFGPKRNEERERWRKLLNEDLQDSYSLPDIIRVMKSRKIMWTEHVARVWR
jgi:hypothetical protein